LAYPHYFHASAIHFFHDYVCPHYFLSVFLHILIPFLLLHFISFHDSVCPHAFSLCVFAFITLLHSGSDICRLENLSVEQIPVFCYGWLMRNWGYIEFETLEKLCWSYLRNIKTTINYFVTNVSHIIYPYFS
jgi:hypothetical protein